MAGIFDPACELLPTRRKEHTCVLLPLYLLFDLPLSPLPKLNVHYIYRQCVAVGVGGVVLNCVVDLILQEGVLHSVSDQIQNLQNCFTTPNKYDQ